MSSHPRLAGVLVTAALTVLLPVLRATSQSGDPQTRDARSSARFSAGWNEIPNTKLRSVSPPNRPWYSYQHFFPYMILAWSSAAYDSRRHQLWVFGGGHSDYYGNESYRFDVATLTWSRIDDPTDLTLLGGLEAGSLPHCLDAWPDGKPSSRHTYDHLEYLPSVDKYFMYGGSRGCGGGAFGQDTWLQDPVTGHWTQMQKGFDHQPQPQPPEYGKTPGRTINAMAVHPDGSLYAMSPYGLRRYDPVANVWSVASERYNLGNTRRRAVIGMGGSRFIAIGAEPNEPPTIRWFNLKSGTRTPLQTVVPQSLSSVLSKKAPGFDIDPRTGKGVAWAGGDEVLLIDLESFQMETRVIPGGPAAVSAGTFGRFRYSPLLGGFLVVSSVDENVRLLKLQ